MRELALLEMEWVTGGTAIPADDGLDDPFRGFRGDFAIPYLWDQNGSNGQNTTTGSRSSSDWFRGLINGIQSALNSIAPSFGVDRVQVTSQSDGTTRGVCLDANGNVIRNANGDPLLACTSTVNSTSTRVTVSFGPN